MTQLQLIGLDDFLKELTNSQDVKAKSIAKVKEYDSQSLQAQGQIGKHLVIKTIQQEAALNIMADVMREQEEENEELTMRLNATEAR